jgi:hypothetical protein
VSDRNGDVGTLTGGPGEALADLLPGRLTGPTMTLLMPPRSPQPGSRVSTGLVDGV